MKVIALVCSAGGLTATQQVLAGLPDDLAAAIIVLQHISPDHPSHLPKILQRASNLPVHAAEHLMKLRRATVYVAPPGYHTLITPQRHISLVPSAGFPPSRPSADLLLSTLATAVTSDAICVIMSGGGHDGATGATAIHVHGGHVLATDMATSQHFSMPAATITRGHVTDAVLPLPNIAQRLNELVTAPIVGDDTQPSPAGPELSV